MKSYLSTIQNDMFMTIITFFYEKKLAHKIKPCLHRLYISKYVRTIV